ncbi:MAG: hypothetical protein ABII82_01835, partial [Verrucomicrobiota bacterium]
VRDRLQTQLAARGLHADYERALIDPTGTLLVERLRLGATDSPDPLLTGRTVLVRLDPWALLTGRVRVDTIEGSGLALYVPAVVSPSGRAEAVLDDGQFRVRLEPTANLLTLDAVSGRIAGLPVALDGDLTLPAPRPRAGARPLDFSAYHPVARRLVTIGEQLRPLGDLTVRGRFSPGRVELVARAARIDLAGLPPSALPAITGEALNATLGLSVPLSFIGRPVARAGVEQLHVELPGSGLPALTAERVQARLTGARLTDWRDWSAFSLEAGADTLSAFPLGFTSTGLRIGVEADGRISAGLLTRVDGQPWRADYLGEPTGGPGVVTLEARPTAGLLQSLEPLVPLRIPLTRLLSLGPAPELRAKVDLAAGGRPRRVEGRLAGGGAVAYGVAIDEAAADFRWEGDELEFNDILLRIDESEARGSYTMSLGTREFRFLLAGRLDPPDIGGWFQGWWGRFWSDFDFSAPATADVEVRGRWGEPLGTAVFVAAEADAVTLRGQPLERLHTRLFIRPGWYDALHVRAQDADGGVAEGRFGLAKDPAGGDWDSLDFDFDSTLPTSALIRLLGAGAEPVFAPYVFTRPPHIRISGEARGSDHRDVRFTASTGSPFLFAGFGVESLHVEGRLAGPVLTLDPMRAGVAGGELTGAGRRFRPRGQPLAGARPRSDGGKRRHHPGSARRARGEQRRRQGRGRRAAPAGRQTRSDPAGQRPAGSPGGVAGLGAGRHRRGAFCRDQSVGGVVRRLQVHRPRLHLAVVGDPQDPLHAGPRRARFRLAQAERSLRGGRGRRALRDRGRAAGFQGQAVALRGARRRDRQRRRLRALTVVQGPGVSPGRHVGKPRLVLQLRTARLVARPDRRTRGRLPRGTGVAGRGQPLGERATVKCVAPRGGGPFF